MASTPSSTPLWSTAHPTTQHHHGYTQAHDSDNFSDTTSDTDGDVNMVLDGPMEWSQRRSKAPVAAIFIHAGAGYHSTTNEKVHLEACAEYVTSIYRVGAQWIAYKDFLVLHEWL